MSTIVYQDMQSYFESHVIETTILKLRVPITQSAIENIINGKCHHHQDTKNLSFNKDDLGNYSYVHPLSKQPSSSTRLSEKSLAICTENLGSETGTDNIIENSIFSFSSPPSSTQKPDIRVESSSLVIPKYKVTSTTNTESYRKLPPLLTTLRGSNSLQVRPHREGGRLVIKAVEAPTMHTYFQAERSNGRLRLCFLTDESFATTTDEDNDESKVENGTFESDTSDNEEEECEEYEEEEEESSYYMTRDMDGNSYNVEVEIGIGKCQRARSCKEARQGNKKFCDWRNPLLVATS